MTIFNMIIIAIILSFAFYTFDMMNKVSTDIKIIKQNLQK